MTETEQAAKSLNVFQRMHAVMNDVRYIQKEEKKREMNYRFVSHDAVTGVLHAALVKHGLVCIPHATCKHDPEPVELKGSQRSRFEFRAEVTLSLEFINVESPTDSVVVGEFTGVGFDNSDKASGKAYSYAYKTALLKTFMLESGERDNEVDDVDTNRGPVASGAEKAIGKTLLTVQNTLKGAAIALQAPKDAAQVSFALDTVKKQLEVLDDMREAAKKANLPTDGQIGTLWADLVEDAERLQFNGMEFMKGQPQ